MLEFIKLGVIAGQPAQRWVRPDLASMRRMSPSGSRTQISGTATGGKSFCRRASRNKSSGAKTEGAVKSFPVKIGGGFGTSARSQLVATQRIYDDSKRCGLDRRWVE